MTSNGIKMAPNGSKWLSIGEISSNLYRASVCDMIKGTFFVNKFIPHFVLHTSKYLVWDDNKYIGQAPRPFMTQD